MEQHSSLDEICFRDVGWLQMNPPLTSSSPPSLILNYFALSPFYDRRCNNELLAMQQRFRTDIDKPAIDQGIISLKELEERLSGLVGIEYLPRSPSISSTTPGTPILVDKRYRQSSAPVVTILDIFYIVDGTIYKCPYLATILQKRILLASWHTIQAFKEARKAITYDDIKKNYQLKDDDQSAEFGTLTNQTLFNVANQLRQQRAGRQ